MKMTGIGRLGLVLLLSCTMSGCGKKEEVQRPLRVSVIIPHDDDGYWSEIKAGMKEAYIGLGENSGIDVKIVVPQVNYNISQMTDLLRQQLAAKVDFIVVQGNNDGDYLAVLRDAVEQGIHVIFMDTDVNTFPEHLYIGTDNYEAGYLIGEKLLAERDGKACIRVISGEVKYQNLEERLLGFSNAIRDEADMEIESIVYDHYDAMTFMRLYREKSEEDTLVCLEGTGAVSLARMFRKHDEAYQTIYAFDEIACLENGVVDGLVRQDMEGIGRKVIEEIARFQKEGSYSADKIYTEISWLTPEKTE